MLVLSNEECGFVISDVEVETLNGGSAKVLEALHKLAAENANTYMCISGFRCWHVKYTKDQYLAAARP